MIEIYIVAPHRKLPADRRELIAHSRPPLRTLPETLRSLSSGTIPVKCLCNPGSLLDITIFNFDLDNINP
jgi:hypothetical protein